MGTPPTEKDSRRPEPDWEGWLCLLCSPSQPHRQPPAPQFWSFFPTPCPSPLTDSSDCSLFCLVPLWSQYVRRHVFKSSFAQPQPQHLTLPGWCRDWLRKLAWLLVVYRDHAGLSPPQKECPICSLCKMVLESVQETGEPMKKPPQNPKEQLRMNGGETRPPREENAE